MAARRKTIYDFMISTVDPPHSDPRSVRHINDEDGDALVRACAPRPVSLGAFHNTVLLVMLMGRKDSRTNMHFEQLAHLQKTYGDRGFLVLVIPTNTFGSEPGSDADSLRFVRSQGAQWPVFCKMRVNGGFCSKAGVDPLILYLRDICPSKERCSNKIEGNYTKFLVDHGGVPRGRFGPDVSPLDMEDEILTLLDANMIIRVASGGGTVQGASIWAHKRTPSKPSLGGRNRRLTTHDDIPTVTNIRDAERVR